MMGLIDILRGNYEFHVGSWTPASPGGSRYLNQDIGYRTSSGIPISQESALTSSTALACTRALCETLATLPACVNEIVGDQEKRKVRDNPMWSLLHDQPNPHMDSITWYGLNASRLINRGNAVNIIEYNGRGLPIALWPVHNSRFEIFRTPGRQGAAGRFFPGEVFYRVWPDAEEIQHSVRSGRDRWFDVPADEVLNIVGFDTQDGLLGTGVIPRLRHELGLDIAQMEYAGSMFKNGAVPLGLIRHPWLDDPEQRDNLRSDINNIHTGRENWNRVGILWDKDAEWQKLNFSPEDVQAIESRIFTAKSICRGYNVPPAIVQIFDDYKFSTVEAMLKQFVTLGLRPLAERFEAAIGVQILSQIGGSDLMLEFTLDALLRGDTEAQANVNAIYRGWGILDADEIRQRDLNMNPLEDGLGKIRLAPMNHAPLEQIAAGPPPEQSEPQQGPPEGEAVFDPSWLRRLAHQAQGSNGSHTPGDVKGVCRHVIAQTLLRMIKKESNAILRRIKQGPDGFLTWIDEYYAKFEPVLSEALSICGGYYEDCDKLARHHCLDSKQQLLSACECDHQQFIQSVSECVALWHNRTPAFEIHEKIRA